MQEIWNIVILSSKDNKYEEEYKHLMDDVNELKTHSNIRYIIYEFDPKAGPANTRIFELAFSGEQVEISAENCRNIYNKEDLINFFKTIVVKENSNTILNRYMVITWGHGAGLGVFAKIESRPLKKILQDGFEAGIITEKDFEKGQALTEQMLLEQTYLLANNSIPEINIYPAILPGFKNLNPSNNLEIGEDNSTLFDNFKNTQTDITPLKLIMLTGADLGEIFSNGFPQGVKVDILISVNCYTQCFEFGNRLRDKVSLLVAPQTMIPFEGINYSNLFTFINDNKEKTIEIKDIAKKLTSNFWAKYESTKLGAEFLEKYPTFPIRATSFSCNDLTFYGVLESLIGEMASILDQLILNKEIKFLIINTRKRCLDLTADGDYGMIDFTVFFQNIITALNIRKKELEALINKDEKKINC